MDGQQKTKHTCMGKLERSTTFAPAATLPRESMMARLSGLKL